MQATNKDLANRLYQSAEVAGSKRFSKPKLSQTGFTVEHYAGPVTYKTDNFLAKNRDFVVAEHQALLQASKEGFVQTLFPAEPEANGNAVRCCAFPCLIPHVGMHWLCCGGPMPSHGPAATVTPKACSLGSVGHTPSCARPHVHLCQAVAARLCPCHATERHPCTRHCKTGCSISLVGRQTSLDACTPWEAHRSPLCAGFETD